MIINHSRHISTHASLVYDAESKKLTVRNVAEFPSEVFGYDQLEILDMSDNRLTSLPESIATLKHLRIAFFSGNSFKQIPPALATCQRLQLVGLKSCGIETMGDHVLPSSLRGLILTDNKLTNLPESIGNYTRLQKLMLTGNRLTSLPRTLLRLQQLELLRVADNHLSSAPGWLAGLPRLSWYVDSGNDFNPTLLDTSSVRNYSWNSMTIGAKLGESAKNAVYSATLRNGGIVAVKVFGHGITTDGSPDSDISASLMAGDHPRLIGGLGRLTDAPGNEQGLVMPLIPKEYRALGLPPDLVNITRDDYTEGTWFPLATAIRITRDIGTALEYLHSKGVMHGDVYAHNILSKPNGESILGDLGAASIYHPSSSEKWRQELDVAGYGHLIEELVERITNDGVSTAEASLRELAAACVDSDSSRRPLFADINVLLARLQP